MKKVLLSSLLLAIAVATNAQSKTYAFTSEKLDNKIYVALREVDVLKGEITKDLYTNTTLNKQRIYFETKTGNYNTESISNDQYNMVAGFGVAAAAFDKVHNRLYFTEMFNYNLKYIDLNKSNITINVNDHPNFSIKTKEAEDNVITRMAIAADGYGYALSNDAKNFIRFSTSNPSDITNLGALKNTSKKVDLHSKQLCWGGDMVGDVYGNLYLFTMSNNVFKINPKSLVAEHLGTIKYLPFNFTTNAAAADEQGNILVASANTEGGYFYKVNPATLEAQPITVKSTKYNISDFANGNLIYQKSANTSTMGGQFVADNAIQINIYPNPIKQRQIAMQFKQPLTGTYAAMVVNIDGKTLSNEVFNFKNTTEQKMKLPQGITPGVHFLRLVNTEGTVVNNTKLLVE